jgi:hypothetical protein
MRHRCLTICSLLLITTAAPAAAQLTAADPAARRDAMRRIAFLVGEWSGDARAMMGPGRPSTLRQTERVYYAVGGQVMVVEGVGRALNNGVVGDTVYHAFGTIEWTQERGYQLRSTTLEGRTGTFPVTLADDGRGLSWRFEVAGGQVRNVMTLTPDGAWHERGEFSRDGQQWFTTMEFTLQRLPAR